MSSVRISSLFPVVCFNNSYLPGANDMSPQQSLRIVTFEGNFTDDWLLSVIYADPIEAFDSQQTSEVSQVATAD